MPPRLLFSTSSKLHVAARFSARHSLNYKSKVAKSTPRPAARHASYYASSTAINASKEVPEHYKSLYTGLDALKRDAANYVDPSRLQLALRSLESRRPVIRIAVLGLQTTRAARRVARLLCAEALDCEGEWERILQRQDEVSANANLLIRYGDKPKLSTSNSMLPTYSIPSRLLQNCNLELIITSLPPSTGTDHVTEASLDPFEAVLVPKLEIPGSFAGQVSIIRLPVHAALVVADGIDGCLSLGRWMSTVPPSETKRWPIQIQVGLDLPAVGQAQENNATLENVAMLDSQKASEALNLFRKSNENATSYEKGWSGSGIQQVLDWIQLQSSDASVAMSPAVGRLIENILENAEAKLTRHVVALPQDDASELAGDSSTVGLNDAAAAWARRSHIELQGKLDAMRQGPVWAKTRWFKLLWRIDDVSLALQELLERNWLVNTEKELIWLAGRGLGEGILNEGVIGSTSFSQHLKDLEAVRKMSDEPTLSASEPSSEDPTSTKADAATDWFSLIPLTRARIAGETIPRMQRQAQVLVLQGLSLTGVSTALSALLYTSLPSFGIYEASTVAAFAVAWSLRQLQKKWEGSRSEWMSKLYEAGRQVLKRTELGIRASIHEGSRRPRNSSGGVVERQAARQALMEVQKALTVLKQETRA